MAYFNAQAAVAAAYNMNSMAAAAAAVQVGMAGNGSSAGGNTSAAMLGLNHISRDHNSGGKSLSKKEMKILKTLMKFGINYLKRVP